MLTNEALMAATPLATLADRKNRVVAPVPGTPLHSLYTAILAKSGYDAKTTLGEAELGGVYSQFVMGSRDSCALDAVVECNNNVVRTGEIAMTHDKIIELAKDTILKQVSFARTVVGPLIESIVTSVNENLLRNTSSALTAYRVVPVSKPAVFGNTVFEGAVDSSLSVGSTGNDFIFDSGFELPVKTGEELLEYMLTGSDSVDMLIREWVAEKGADMLREIWAQFFTQNFIFGTTGTEYGNCVAIIKDRLGEEITFGDLVTALFLLTKRVKADVPGGTGLSKSRFDSVTDLYMKYSAGAVRASSDIAATQLANGLMVYGVREKTVYVNSDVYNKWLGSEHADVEAILGVLVSKKQYTYVLEINDAIEELKRSWKAHVELTKMTEQSMLTTDIVRAMIYHFGNVISERIGTETSEKAGQVAQAIKRFEQEINGYTAAEIKTIWTPLIRSVCRAAYPNTNAEEILLGMNDAAEVNPDISKRALATIVVAKMINRWVISQLTVR